MAITVRKFGWKPPRPDHNRLRFLWHFPFLPVLNDIPHVVDLESKCPSVYDQLALGSCTANAAAGLAEFLMMKLHPADVYMPARLPIYYYERVIEGTVDQDSGASLADAMNVLTNRGVAHESMFPYDISKFTHRPSLVVEEDGWKHKVKPVLSIGQDVNQLRGCLAAGFPVIFGFSVYDSFEQGNWDSTTGIMPMPKMGEGILGGHAVMAVGYDSERQLFKIRNSWGTGWGLSGYFYMPFTFLLSSDYASDFWTAYDIWG